MLGHIPFRPRIPQGWTGPIEPGTRHIWCAGAGLRSLDVREGRAAEGYHEFVTEHNRLAGMQGYALIPTVDHAAACRQAFASVRRDVWSERESRLVAKWESYG
jgi:hypothetical protein